METFNKNLKTQYKDGNYEVLLCGQGKCKCPSIYISEEKDNIVLGGNEEGFTNFTKEQFKLFVDEIKNGTFDKFI